MHINYINKNRPEWEELEQLVKRAQGGRRAIKKLTAEELNRLDVLYRRTAVHLAQVATRTQDHTLIQYLNNLTAAAHSIIYVPPKQSIIKQMIKFGFEGFARVIVKTWKYHAISALLFLFGFILAYFAVQQDPTSAYALLPSGEFRQPGATQEQLIEVLRSGRESGEGQRFAFASLLFVHNLKIGILSITTGVLAAIPTVFCLIYNGMCIGALTSVYHGSNVYSEYWAWILPHGITELMAIIFCGGIGLRLGHAIINPGRISRKESLYQAGIHTAKVCVGVAGMLIFAAIIEGYLRQSQLSTVARLIFAFLTLLFWVGYFAKGLHCERQQDKPKSIANKAE